jgi:hypothetical protein
MSAFNLLADYGLDEGDIPENVGRKNTPDGTYPFTVTDFRVQEGTTNNPDTQWIILDHDLGEDGQQREWFTISEDGDKYTDKVKNSLSFLRKRLAFYGQTLAGIDFDEVVGRTGTLTLETRGKFQNITEYSIDEDGDDGAEPAEAPAARPQVSRPAAGKAGAGDSPFGGKRRS